MVWCIVLEVHKQRFYTSDFPLLLISTCIFYFIIFTGNQISRPEGFILLLSITAILFYLFIYQKKSISEFSDDFDRSKISISKSFLHIIFSGFLLWLGSETLIKSAISVAREKEINLLAAHDVVEEHGTGISGIVDAIIYSSNDPSELSTIATIAKQSADLGHTPVIYDLKAVLYGMPDTFAPSILKIFRNSRRIWR